MLFWQSQNKPSKKSDRQDIMDAYLEGFGDGFQRGLDEASELDDRVLEAHETRVIDATLRRLNRNGNRLPPSS